MNGLSRIGGRLTKLLPVLASDRSAEVAAAAAAITRTLHGAGLDWHTLAALTEADAKRQAVPVFAFASLPPRTARKQTALLARTHGFTPAERVRHRTDAPGASWQARRRQAAGRVCGRSR